MFEANPLQIKLGMCHDDANIVKISILKHDLDSTPIYANSKAKIMSK
jgi:hypothetical protein